MNSPIEFAHEPRYVAPHERKALQSQPLNSSQGGNSRWSPQANNLNNSGGYPMRDNLNNSGSFSRSGPSWSPQQNNLNTSGGYGRPQQQPNWSPNNSQPNSATASPRSPFSSPVFLLFYSFLFSSSLH